MAADPLEVVTTFVPLLPSVASALVLSFSVRTRGDVTWIVSVRIDLVLVTAMAASPGHWLTVYVPAEFSYLKQTNRKKLTLLIFKNDGNSTVGARIWVAPLTVQ